MKKIIESIKLGDLEGVKEILDKNPDAINIIAKQPPKKDDGQSLLQIAIKTGNIKIAELLLDYGANINFIESEDSCNEWRIPVLHDSIRMAIMSSRWNTKEADGKTYVEYNTKESSEAAFDLLKRIFELGADINLRDSYGNTCLDRAILDSLQILPSYNYQNHELCDDRKLTVELKEDLSKIFNLLYSYGANIEWRKSESEKTIKEKYNEGPIVEFLKKV